jgi:hypothetical protein
VDTAARPVRIAGGVHAAGRLRIRVGARS